MAIWRKIILLVAAICAGVAAADPQQAADDLAARNDAVVRGLQNLRKTDALSAESALALIQKEMSPIIDFQKLAGQAVGKYWRRATDAEKAGIIKSFQLLLENTYAKVLSRYSDQAVRIAESKLRDDGKTEVKIEISDGNL
ncbi:MAG: ABC transporter substrate-binding protein, partial [Betaproteobacteria bacterium]|nr:ABC transporter substrate-binding protein [Betaproteobacteria bacterium]